MTNPDSLPIALRPDIMNDPDFDLFNDDEIDDDELDD